MAELKGTQSVPIDTMRIDAFAGGMNTSADETEIANNEAFLIENFEYDKLNNLMTRNGVSNGGSAASTKILSIFSFVTDAGFIGNIFTRGTQIRSRPLVLGTDTNLTGALSLPDSSRWYWKSLNNVAVGVNGATGSGNPIQVVGPAPGTASHLAAAPDGKYIEEWDSRLFIVHAANLNRVQCSDLGTATVWNTDGLLNPAHGIIFDVVPGDSDVITALYATKERLFIFKRRRVYILRSVSTPRTDPNTWELVEYSQKDSGIGCVAQTTVREVFDDVVFLSEGGLMSLAATETATDFESALLSGKISAIQDLAKNIPETDVFSYNLTDKSQYWLMVSSTFSPTNKNTTFVLDYSKIRSGIVRWTQNDQLAYGSSMELYNQGTDQLTYLLGCDDPNSTDFFIGTYKPNALTKMFADGSLAINQVIETKLYDFLLPDIRKYLMEWYLAIKLQSQFLSLGVSFFVDNSEVVEHPYSFGLEGSVGGDFFDVDLFDTALYDQGIATLRRMIRRAFLMAKQRKVLTVKAKIACSQINQGFTINKFGIKYGILSENKAHDV